MSEELWTSQSMCPQRCLCAELIDSARRGIESTEKEKRLALRAKSIVMETPLW